MPEFTDKIKALRKDRNLTQKQLAAELGLNERNYQHYEAGTQKPSYDGIVNLAKFFQVSADYLLGLTDNPGRS